MDLVLCKKDFPRCKYSLIAMTALLLAAKYDELDMNIPSIIELRRFASAKVLRTSVDEYKEYEGILLKMLDWNLRVITPFVFVELLLTQGVLHSSDRINGIVPSLRITKELSKKALFLCESLLKNYDVQQYPPSVIAAGVILTARKLLNIEPQFSKELDFLIADDPEKIKDCTELILKSVSEEKKPTESFKKEEKILELNKNFTNVIPKTQPRTTKATEIRKDSFNIVQKRAEIENIKKNIKAKLISLNKKSKTIETLLENDIPQSRGSALHSYRASHALGGANSKSMIDGTQERGKSSLSSVPSQKLLFRGAVPTRESNKQYATLKPNCSFVASAHSLYPIKEKENKQKVTNPRESFNASKAKCSRKDLKQSEDTRHVQQISMRI